MDNENLISNTPKFNAINEAKDAFEVLSEFLEKNPKIEDAETAERAKLRVDVTRAAIKEMEEERVGRVRPLNETVSGINGEYKAISEPLARLFEQLLSRINVYIQAERERREAEAAEARRKAEEAIRAAEEAALAEQRAIDTAEAGQSSDIGSATAEADYAFRQAKRVGRAAAVAEKSAAKVGIGGGLTGRALTQRTSETLAIVDWSAALADIVSKREGALPEKVEAALITAARDYRKAFGKLPSGVSSDKSRSL